MKRKKRGGFQKKPHVTESKKAESESTDAEASELDKTFEEIPANDISNKEGPTKETSTEDDSDMEISFNLSTSKSILSTPVSVRTPQKKPGRKTKGVVSKTLGKSDTGKSTGDDSTKSRSKQEEESKDEVNLETPRSTRIRVSASINEQKNNSINEKDNQHNVKGLSEVEEDRVKDKESKKGRSKGRLVQVQPLNSDQFQETKTSEESVSLKRRSTRNNSVLEPNKETDTGHKNTEECKFTEESIKSKNETKKELHPTKEISDDASTETEDRKKDISLKDSVKELSKENETNQKKTIKSNLNQSQECVSSEQRPSPKRKPGRKSKLNLEENVIGVKNEPCDNLDNTNQVKSKDNTVSQSINPIGKQMQNNNELKNENVCETTDASSKKECYLDQKEDVLESPEIKSVRRPKHMDEIGKLKIDQIIDDLESLESSQSEEEEWSIKKKSPKKASKKGKKGRSNTKSNEDREASEESSREEKTSDNNETPDTQSAEKKSSPKKKPGRKPKHSLDELKIIELLEENSDIKVKKDLCENKDELPHLEKDQSIEVEKLNNKYGVEHEISEDQRKRKQLSNGIEELSKAEPKRKPGRKPKKKPGRRSKQDFSPLRASSPLPKQIDQGDLDVRMEIDNPIEAEKPKTEDKTPIKYNLSSENIQGSGSPQISPLGSGRRGIKRKPNTPCKSVASKFIEKYHEMFSDPIKIPTFQVVTAIEGDTLLVSPKKKRGRPKGSPNKSPKCSDSHKVPVKFMMPKSDMNDDKHFKTGGEDYLPTNSLMYNGASPTQVYAKNSPLDTGKIDLDDEEHEVDLDTGDEIIVKPESSVLSPVKTRRISLETASSNLELANKAEDIEVEVTSAIAKTLQLVTPGFISSENCEKVLELIPNETQIEKIMFGYFFWVIVDKKSHTFDAIKAFRDAGFQSVAYCHECIHYTDAALNKHREKCKNEDDLVKLCKVVVSDTPTFDEPDRVLLVYSSSLVLLSDVEQLKNIYKDSVLLIFSKFCFIECKSMINSLNLHKILHENDKSDFGFIKCYKVNSTFNYQTYSARSPHKAKVSKERETMRKTLDLYELQKGDHSKALLLLGQAVKNGNKSKNNRFLNWVKRLFGTECEKVVTGTIAVDHNGEKLNTSKRGPVSDYTIYNVAFFRSGAAATAAYKRCNLLYMYGSHLNIVQMISFMHTPPNKKLVARGRPSAIHQLKSPSKVESSQLPLSAFLPGTKFEPGASAFSGSEDEVPMSDSDLEPPKKKILAPSKLTNTSIDVFDSLLPAGPKDKKSETGITPTSLKSGPSPTVTFLPKNGLISCLFCRKEKDSTCKELKTVCIENKLMQRLCEEQTNFNPEDFVLCQSCYETLPVIEVFTNRDVSSLITAWDYMEVAKQVKTVIGDLIQFKLNEKEKEHIKQVKNIENNVKMKFEEKLWDKDQDLEDLREQIKVLKNDTKLEDAQNRIAEVEKNIKLQEDHLSKVNSDKSKLEQKVIELEKDKVIALNDKNELSNQVKELTIKVESLDKDSIKSVVREEMLKDEIITKDNELASKDSVIENLNKKVKSLEDEINISKEKRVETQEEQLSVAQEELDNIRTELSNVNAELEVKEKALSEKEVKAEEFRDKWREAEAKLAKRLNEITKLGETVSKHALEIKECQAKHVSELKECKSKHLEEIDALEHKLHNISQTVEFKEECLQLLRDKRIDTFFHEVKVDVTKISEKELNPRDLEIFKSKKQHYESVSEELCDLKEKFSNLEKSFKAEVREKEKWKGQLLESQLEGMEVPQLSQKLEDLKSEKIALEAKVANLEKKNKTSSESSTALENLQLQLEFQKAETERMQKEIKDTELKIAESKLEVLGDAKKEMETLKNSLQLEEEKSIQLKANLKSEQEKNSQYRTNIKMLEKDLDETKKLKSDLRSEQSKTKSLKSDFEQLKKLNDQIIQEKDRHKSRLEEMRVYRDKYDSIKKKKNECDSQIDDLKKEVEALKAKEKKKSVESDELLQNMKDSNAGILKDNESLKKSLEAKTKESKKFQASQEQQQKVLENLEERIKQVSSERSELLDQLQTKSEMFESERKSHEEVIKSLENQKQGLQDRVDTLAEGKIKYGKKLATALDDIKVEQKKQKEFQEINETMKLEIASLRVKMGGEKKDDLDDELYDRLGKMYEDIEKDRLDRDAEREKVKLKDEEINKLKEEHQRILSEEKQRSIKETPKEKEDISKQKLLIENLNKQIIEYKKDILKAKDDKANLDLIKTKLESEKDEMVANHKELSAELENLVANEDKLKKSIEEQKALVEGSDKKIAAMMEDHQLLKEEKFVFEEKSKKEIDKIKNEKNDKDKELKKIKAESKSRDDTFEQLIKEKAEAVRKAEYLKLELEEVKEEVKANEVSVQDKRRLSSLNSEIEDLRRRNKQLESSDEGKNKIFSALKAENNQLKAQNKVLQTDKQGEATDKEKDKKIIDDKLKEIQVLKKDVDLMFAEKSVLKKQLQELKELDNERKQKEIEAEKKFNTEKSNYLKQIKDQEKQLKDQEKQLKDQEKLMKETDTDKKFSLEKNNLLKQMKEMQAEKALNETYKKEMLELSGEIRKKCTQYDVEVSKNKTLTEKLEEKEKEVIALKEKCIKQEQPVVQSSTNADEEDVEALKQKIDSLEKKNKKLNKTVAMLTKDEDDEDFLREDLDIKPKVQTLEDQKSPKPGGLTLKNTASLLKEGVSSPFSNKPEARGSGSQSPALSRPPKLMSPNIQLNPHVTIGPVPRGRGRGGLTGPSPQSARSTPSPQTGRSNPSPNLARSNPSPSLTRFNPSPNQSRSNPSPISNQPRPGQTQGNRPNSNPSQSIKTPPPNFQRTMSTNAGTSNQAVSSPIPTCEDPGTEADDIENDLYEGLVEALEEAQNQRSNTEVQCKYEELLKNLLDKMPDNKDQIIRSLNRAFATVFPGTTVGTAKTSTCSATKTSLEIRASGMEEIITPGAAASAVSPSSQLNSQLASLGARGVQVQPFQQVQQQVVVPQQGMVIQQTPQQSRAAGVPQQQRMAMAQQQNRIIQQQQQNRVMVSQQQQQQNRMLVPQQSRMIVPQQSMVPQQNLVQNQQSFVQQSMMVPQQNMVYSQPQQGVMMQQQQQQQQPQYIMTQAVPQQMQQVNINQQMQQQGYQVVTQQVQSVYYQNLNQNQ